MLVIENLNFVRSIEKKKKINKSTSKLFLIVCKELTTLVPSISFYSDFIHLQTEQNLDKIWIKSG